MFNGDLGAESASRTALETGLMPSGIDAGEVRAAIVSIQDHRMLVVLMSLDVARSPGEADMLIVHLRPRFGNVEPFFWAQDDDGTPHYHRNTVLAQLLADVPIDKMPSKAYCSK